MCSAPDWAFQGRAPPGWGHCVAFLCKTLQSHLAPLYPGAVAYSCFEKACGEKLTQQCRRLWVMVVFTVPWVNHKVFEGGGKKQHKHTYSFFSFLVAEPPWTSINQNEALATHNANWDCRVRFYTLVEQSLLKQLGYWFCRLRWLHIGQVFFLLVYGPRWESRSINSHKKNQANIQPSWSKKLGQ